MNKLTTLTIWSVDTPAGTEFFTTRRSAKAFIDQMIEEGEFTGWQAKKKPHKRELLLTGRTLMDALCEGIRIGQANPHDDAM